MKHPLAYPIAIALLILAAIAGAGFLTLFPKHSDSEKSAPPSVTLSRGAYTFFAHHDEFDKYQRIIGHELGFDSQKFDVSRFMNGTYATKLGFTFTCLYAKNHASLVGASAGSGNKELTLLVFSSATDNIATLQWSRGGVVDSRELGRPSQLKGPLRTYVENLNSGKWSCSGKY